MSDSEFAFELRVCQWAERAWPPDGDRDNPVLVARQLGTKRRRWDTIVVECDRAGLRRRAAFGRQRLDSDLRHVLGHAHAEWAYYRDALPHPGYPWRYVREAIHTAADRGVLDRRKRGNRIEIRRKYAYPDWIERIVAIENKPDLDASAASRLAPQLERDVALGLADEVWVATERTDERVEPILLEDLPAAAGVLTIDPSAVEADVAWYPQSLAVSEPGTRIEERPDDDLSAARFEYVDPEWKAKKRRSIAERAYERGWRAYAESLRPDCRHFQLRTEGDSVVPYCEAKERVPTPSTCRAACRDCEPEPPTWRTGGWPIDGGPGAGIRRLLDDQRRRHRPGLDDEAE